MSETLPTIDFGGIRTYDGAQSGGFEQLAVELFAREHGLSRQLVRVNGAGGDGGVEAYAESADKGKLGMQAKYFDRLGDAQWKQIDKSVKAALNQHPNIKEYRVYVPLDRTKGRLDETKGQVEKWNQLVKAWHKLTNGADVEFSWKGRYEVELALKDAKCHDLLFYWFGTPQFDDDWMDRLIRASLQTLGERYQSNRHVNEHVGRELDRFVRSPASERLAEEAYVEFAEHCLSFTAENDDHRTVVEQAIEEAVRGEYPAYGLKRVDQVRPQAQALLNSIHELASSLRKQRATTAEKRDERLESRIYGVERFAEKVGNWADLLDLYGDTDYQCALVKGDAGSGKSHLIAHCSVQARQRKQPLLLVLGEQFLGDRPPLIQLCEHIDWSGGPTSLLSALNVAGSLVGCPALLFVDALNESTERRLWKSHLHAVAAAVRQYPHVRLIVSCRSDFVGITLPNDFKTAVPNGWAQIDHRGFGDVLAEAVARYFKSYKIQSPHFPPLLDEFRNPLFLDTFCRAFENQVLPEGPVTLQTVMERRISRLAEKLREDIDCDEHHVRQAIRDLAEKIRGNNGSAVEEAVARAVIEPHSPSTESSRSLYTHLKSNGMIVERVDRFWEKDPTIFVRFAFERFSDYFIARGLLSDVGDVAALREWTQSDGRLAWTQAWKTYSNNRGIARALAVLVPEQFGVELVDLLPKVEHLGDILTDLLDSLPWRSGASITESTKNHLLEASRWVSNSSFIETLLRVSTIPHHPLNAGFLHGKLAAMTLAGRDAIWTIPICDLAAHDDTLPSTLVEWAIQVPRDLVSDDQATLVATVLLWFGSSNQIGFRSRAGLAAIRILHGRPMVVSTLVEKFDGVNDPYVVERLYAVACGVAMREPPGDGLRGLAATVHRLFFATKNVRSHVLLRDYAQTLLLTAEHRGCVESSIDQKSYRPPFKSRMPSIIGEAKVKQFEEDESWRRIVWSVRPEGMGMYGDFGRYVMGYAVHNFLAAKKHEAIPEKPFLHRFDAKRARRWVLQRVKSLGWTGKRFGEYDRNRHDHRLTDDEHKVERISKKYQWIALHELLGSLSDHHHMRPDWGDRPQTYQGAWQISQRDFDPSAEPRQRLQASDDDGKSQVPANVVEDQWTNSNPYPDPFANQDLLANRAEWVKSHPDDPACLLTAKRANDARQWLVLDGYWSWKEPRILRLRHGWDGRCEMWIHARTWLVKKEDRKKFVDRIRRLNFWGHGIQGVSLGDGWIGEYPHSPAFDNARHWCEQPDDLTKKDKSLHVRATSDWDRQGGAIVPSPQLCDLLGLQWSGESATFCDSNGAAVATAAPLPNAGETSPGVVLADRLRAGLTREGLEIVWAIVGERRCWNGEKMVGDVETQFSGVYTLLEDGIDGGLTVVEIVQLPLRS